MTNESLFHHLSNHMSSDDEDDTNTKRKRGEESSSSRVKKRSRVEEEEHSEREDDSDSSGGEADIANDDVRVVDRNEINSIFSIVHGNEEDSVDFEEELNQYTKSDWKRLSENLLQSNLDPGCSDRELLSTFHLFYKLFCHPFKTEYDVIDRLSAIYPNVTTMQDQFKKIQRTFGLIHFELLKRRQLDEESRSGRELKRMLTLISFSMKTSFEQLVLTRMMQHGSDTMTRSMLEEMTPEIFFQEVDISKMKKHQQILYFYLRKAFKNNYKKDGDSLYKPRYNKYGEFVHAYEYVCDISDFVFQGIFPLEQNQYWFDCLTEKSNTAKTCIQHLTSFKTEWLQDLERNPSIHSFQNGLFVTRHNAFFHFKKVPGRNWVGQLDGNLTATKYHDIIFDEEGMESDMNRYKVRTYMAIEMPPVHTILTTQKFSSEERRWIFCLLGRLLFPVGKWDTWSVFPYFLGLAGTGKSTCLRLVAELFEKRDVGYLNNTLQKTFALEGICDKLLYLALDIDEDFQLDQATFQSMVCGEEVSIIRKYKQPMTVIWKIHGGFAGNKLPTWTDNGGSLSRRLVIIEFQRMVTKSDPNLFEKCLDIRDRFLKVITSAYQELTEKYNSRGIKEVIPEKFKQSEKKALLELNCLLQFVTEYCEIEQCSDDDEERIMVQSFNDFNKAFKEYCRRLSIRHRTLNYSFYNGVFAKYQIKVVDPIKNGDKYGQTAKYILGLKLKEDALEGVD
jgi:hypothetical protein